MIGVTKNSVISRSHRLKLGPWSSVSKTRVARAAVRQARRTEKPRQSAQRAAVGFSTEVRHRNAEEIRAKLRNIDKRRAAELPPLRASIVELEQNECKFPYGDDKTHQFCGRRRHPGMPYCLAHARICFDLPEEVEARPRPTMMGPSARVEKATLNALRSLESFVCVP
jgi:GcrA cell cycle regulator